MIRGCDTCHKNYDDAEQLTYCPHHRFISDEDRERKDLAFSLIGKALCFNHQPEGPVRRLQYITHNGMVGIEGMTGEFAPHLFRVVKE